MRISTFIVSAGILFLVILASGCTKVQSTQPSENQTPVDLSFTYLVIPPPSDGSQIVFTEQDNGKGYAFPENTEFTVNLTETLATNNPWKVSLSPGLTLLDSRYYANASMPRFDVGGTHVWTLEATGSGPQSFHAGLGAYGNSSQGNYTVLLQVIPRP